MSEDAGDGARPPKPIPKFQPPPNHPSNPRFSQHSDLQSQLSNRRSNHSTGNRSKPDGATKIDIPEESPEDNDGSGDEPPKTGHNDLELKKQHSFTDEKKKRKPALSFIRRLWLKFPRILRAWIPAVFLGGAILAPSVVIYYLITPEEATYDLLENRADEDGNLSLTWQMELLRWSIVVASTISLQQLATDILARVTFLLCAVLNSWFYPVSDTGRIHLNTLKSISPQLGNVLTAGVLIVLSNLFLRGPLLRGENPNFWIWLIVQTPVVLLIIAVALTVEMAIILLISANFQRVAYGQRVKDSNRALEVLDVLAEPAAFYYMGQGTKKKKRSKKEEAGLFGSISKKVGLDTIAKRTNLALNTAMQVLTLEDPNVGVEGRTQEGAERAASQIYWFLVGNNPYGKDTFDLSDLQRVFKKNEDAETAFRLFDSNGNGAVSYEEVVREVGNIYRERRDLEKNIIELGAIVGRLHDIFLTIIAFIVIILAFLVYEVDFTAFLASLGTVALSLSFVFGSSAATTFNCIIFLFVMHPYDIGDRVFIDGENMVVDEINILTTVFTRWDGQSIIMANQKLHTKDVHNVRRSGPQAEMLIFEVSSTTDMSTIAELERRLTVFLSENPQLYGKAWKEGQIVSFGGYDTEDAAKLTLKVGLSHPSNWQDNALRWSRRTKLLQQIKIHMTELGMEYLPPVQRVRQV